MRIWIECLHEDWQLVDVDDMCIDTGCGFGGLLTALDVASGRTWQADEAGRVVTEDGTCQRRFRGPISQTARPNAMFMQTVDMDGRMVSRFE